MWSCRCLVVITKTVALRIRNRGGLFAGYGNWSHFNSPAPQIGNGGGGGGGGGGFESVTSESGSDSDSDSDSDSGDGGDDPILVAVTDLSDDTICLICQETVTEDSVYTSCYHCFHTSCLDRWAQVQHSNNPRRCPTCPACRADLFGNWQV